MTFSASSISMCKVHHPKWYLFRIIVLLGAILLSVAGICNVGIAQDVSQIPPQIQSRLLGMLNELEANEALSDKEIEERFMLSLGRAPNDQMRQVAIELFMSESKSERIKTVLEKISGRGDNEITKRDTTSAQSIPVDTDNILAIKDVRLFDGVQWYPQATVVVNGGSIESVHLGKAPVLSESMKQVSGIGKTLFPGLIDAHVHVWAEPYLAESLKFGVTTVLDMAHPNPASANQMQAKRGKPEYSHYSDYFSAVISPTSPGGHGTQFGIEFPTITEPEEAEAFIADRVAEGSDYIKITTELGSPRRPLNWIPPPTLKALIEESHKHNLLAVAHISDPAMTKFAIESGLDGSVHIWTSGVDSGARPDIAALAKRKGAFFVPTMTVFERSLDTGGAASLLSHPYLKPLLIDEAKEKLGPKRSKKQLNADALAAAQKAKSDKFKSMQDAVRSLYEAGVTILVGSDAPNPGTWHGVSVHREMELLVDVGMSPVEVLHAATAAAAKAFRLDDRGRLAPGLRADMVLVEGDPTTNILDTRNLIAIWKGGILLGDSVSSN